MVEFINKKEMYFFERIYRYASVNLVIKLSKTKITPNMITFLNIILAFFNSILLLMNKFNLLSALLLVVYYFLDVVDGNLARCTGKTSKLGARLDAIGDGVFYNIFIICIGKNHVSLVVLIFIIFIHNIHSILATYYIVPNIRKIKNFNRYGLKKKLMDKGIILGVDLSLVGILLSIALITKEYVFIYGLVIILYAIDILYRVIELNINKYKLNSNI